MCEHRDRVCVLLESRPVSDGVTTNGQTANDAPAMTCEEASDALDDQLTVRRRLARSDHGNGLRDPRRACPSQKAGGGQRKFQEAGGDSRDRPLKQCELRLLPLLSAGLGRSCRRLPIHLQPRAPFLRQERAQPGRGGRHSRIEESMNRCDLLERSRSHAPAADSTGRCNTLKLREQRSV